MLGVRRQFVAMCLTWGMISLPGFSSASNTPGKPTDLRVSSVHDLTITLKWTKPLTTAGTPDNSTLTYLVSHTAVGSNTHDRLTVTTESAQLDLSYGEQYNIYVKAIRSGDRSDWSDALRVNTNDLVPAKPINLQVADVKGLVITMSWDKPRTTKKGITDTSTLGYYLSFNNLESNTKRQIQSNRRQFSLRLEGNSRYEIKVLAFKVFDTSAAGPWSDSFTFKTNESVPSKPPTNVKVVSSTSSSILVTWGQIPQDGTNGIILGYVVFYREQGSSQWSERDVNLVYSKELTGLATGKQYSVRVAGYTKIGQGIKSVAKGIIVKGQLITTTEKVTTQKPTTLPEKPHSRSAKPYRTGSVHLGTLATTSTEDSHRTTDAPSSDPYTRTSTYTSGKTAIKPSVSTMQSSQGHQSDQSTPVVSASVGKADGGSKENFLNKIMMIGAPAAGGLLLLIILIIVFVLSVRRSRRRKQLQQNGEIPMQIMKAKRKRKRSKDVVTRGANSVTYEPPSGHSTLTRDSLTVGLLQTVDEPDQPVIIVQQPNGTLPRTEADDAPLLATGCSDKYDHLRVDLSGGQSKLEDGRASGLYDSIGSFGINGCSDAAKAADGKSDDEERYVTQEQIDATRDKAQVQAAPQEGHYKRPKPEPHYKRPKADREVANDVPNENTYENLPDTDHLYEDLGLKSSEDPVYENTRAFSGNQENVDRDGEYEPMIPMVDDARF
ncbi:hypothetical protein ACROYT_G020353 [Oculina patagonica]